MGREGDRPRPTSETFYYQDDIDPLQLRTENLFHTRVEQYGRATHSAVLFERTNFSVSVNLHQQRTCSLYCSTTLSYPSEKTGITELYTRLSNVLT